MSKLRSGLLGLMFTSVVALASANAADMYEYGEGPGGYGPGYGPGYRQVYVADTWTGFYAGVNGGGGWSSNSRDEATFSSFVGSSEPSGAFGGGQIGYNVQGALGGLGFGNQLVLGIEADFQGADISDTSPFGVESSLNWFGSVRGRVGYAFDRTLIYFTGGLAFGEVELKGNVFGPFDVTETQTGYVLGGGLEYKITPAWSLKGEYQFISLDASDPNGAGPLGLSSNTDRTEVHTLRAALNYHFGQTYIPLK